MSSEIIREENSLGTVKVLDHGHVRLISVMGSDLAIVRAARVSYDAAERAGEDEGSDFRLLRYLMSNEHTTPFEMVEFTFDCAMPIFIARQWIRHRMASVNEVSARYTKLPDKFYLPRPEVVGKQSPTNKQARDLHEISNDEKHLRAQQVMKVETHCDRCYALYEELIEEGWPRELARMVLPLNIYTHWFWKIDLKNLLHFLKLRLDKHAQWEFQQYGQAIHELITPHVPQTMRLFDEIMRKK